jgi:drug/metabolite transporter (DMT)-like permease
LWTTNMRVASGLFFLAVPILAHPRRKLLLGPLTRKANWKFMIPATVLGTYLSIIAWIGGMKYTQVSVASALNQLNTVFIFIMAVLILKEKATLLKVAAVALAVAGAILAAAA